jgi:hypothetical protein
MPGPTTEHLAEDTKELAAAMNGLRADFSGLKSVAEKEFADAKAFEKWVKNILIAVVLSAGGVIWGASALNSEVKVLATRFDKLDGTVEKLEGRFDQFERRMDKSDAKLDQIEKRMDKSDGKLDQILQRLDQIVPKKGGL